MKMTHTKYHVVVMMDNFAGSMNPVTRPSPMKMVTGRQLILKREARPVPAYHFVDSSSVNSDYRFR